MSNTIKPVDQGMNNKIGDKLGETSSTKKLEHASPAVRQDVRGESRSADTVKLTDTAKLLERTEKSLADAAVVDTAKISAVRADIANGDYVINADKIAEALLRTDMELSK